MTTAFLFAGQGSQIVGMAKDFYDHCPSSKELMDNLHCDYDIKKLCFEGPQETLNDTAYAQSSIVAASLMILEGLKSKRYKTRCMCRPFLRRIQCVMLCRFNGCTNCN